MNEVSYEMETVHLLVKQSSNSPFVVHFIAFKILIKIREEEGSHMFLVQPLIEGDWSKLMDGHAFWFRRGFIR